MIQIYLIGYGYMTITNYTYLDEYCPCCGVHGIYLHFMMTPEHGVQQVRYCSFCEVHYYITYEERR